MRRRWPQAMVSWSRLLAGSWRDPLVGRDVLVGCVWAAVLRLVAGAGRVLPSWLGEPPPRPPAFNLLTLSGGAAAVSNVLGRLWQSILVGLVILFVLVLFRILFRKTWLAVLVFVLIFGLVPALAREATRVTPVVTAVALAALLFALVRFGVLAVMACPLFSSVFELFPVTTDVSAWYAGLGFLGLTVVLVLAVYGFHVSLGGRPLFGEVRAGD